MTENAPEPGALIPRVAGNQVVDVRTQELVDLKAAGEDWLADYLAFLREIDDASKLAKRLLQIEIHRRLDRAGKYTREAGPYRVVGQGPLTAEYDPGRTREALEVLLEEGKIDAETLERCCPLEEVAKPKKGELAKLRRGNEDADALLAEAEKPVDQESRRVKIEELPVRFRDDESDQVLEGEVVAE